MKCIEFTNEKKYIKDFLKLPKKLYTKENNTEDSKTIIKFLLGTHPLSKYFKLHKYLIYDNEQVVGRFILTTYENDPICYIGFFECINDKSVAKLIFKETRQFAKSNGYKKIVGPVDASFWNKYRLKINLFDKRPYTCEPYNKDYYLKLFTDNNFKIIEHYTSNIFNGIDDSYKNNRFSEKYQKIIDSGVKIISPKIEDYDKTIEELYYLITDLYSDFPIYKDLSKEDFISIFHSYKSILNMDMLKMAYYDNKLVGFFISLPNYHNRVYNLSSIKNIIDILKIKKKPFEYVLLYIGASKEHKGLGSALTEAILNELRSSNLPCIGALARDGKVTQQYASELIINQYEYVLLEGEIND